jgi:deoxyribonuclease V
MMILAVDVHYHEDCAQVAGILFWDWRDVWPAAERGLECEAAGAYQPGEFFRRELPCIERLLQEINEPLECIVVDGFVYLGRERRAGLGKYVFDALNGQVPVIGVAKTAYRDTPKTTQVFRGRSKRPLYVTAAGISDELARECILTMHGEHRIPTLLQRVDRLCRQGSAPGHPSV